MPPWVVRLAMAIPLRRSLPAAASLSSRYTLRIHALAATTPSEAARFPIVCRQFVHSIYEFALLAILFSSRLRRRTCPSSHRTGRVLGALTRLGSCSSYFVLSFFFSHFSSRSESRLSLRSSDTFRSSYSSPMMAVSGTGRNSKG